MRQMRLSMVTTSLDRPVGEDGDASLADFVDGFGVVFRPTDRVQRLERQAIEQLRESAQEPALAS